MQGNPMDDETSRTTIEAVQRLDAAFDRGDIDAFMSAMTDDCVWESFTPAPNGQRHEGQAAVRQAMADFLGSSRFSRVRRCLAVAIARSCAGPAASTADACEESMSCGSATGRSPRSS